MAVLLLSIASAASTPVGRRVVDVLHELRDDGWVFIYTTQTMDEELRVTRAPRATGGVDLAREILAEHGLDLLQVGPQTFAVVRGRAASREPSEVARTPTTLAEIVVQTSRYTFADEALGAHTVFTQAQVNSLPRLGDEPLRAVQRLPGAASDGWRSLGAIRGGAPNEIGIVLDGMRLYEPFHLKNFLSPVSVLDARLLDSIDVHLGGFPARFGDRMSAIIEARTIQPTAERYYELGLSAFHANGLMSAVLTDDVRLLMSARRSNLSELVRFAEQDFGTPAYADGFARVHYVLDARTRMSLSALLSRDDVVARQDAGAQNARAEYRNDYVWATLARDWQDGAHTDVLFGFTDVTNDRRGRVDAPKRQADIIDRRDFRVMNVRVDHAWSQDWHTRSLRQQVGTEWRVLSSEYRYASEVLFAADYPFPGVPALRWQRDLALAPHGNEQAAYWDARLDLGARWALNAGLRFDRQSDYSQAHIEELSPRVNALFAVAPTMKLRAGWGRFFQLQAINELPIEDGVEQFFRPQCADHFTASFEHELPHGVVWRIEAYRKYYRTVQPRFENLFDPLSLLPEAEYDRSAITPSSARAEGMELLLTARPAKRWTAWVGYAWSQAADYVSGRNEPRSWDQRHALNAGVHWDHERWSFTVAGLYHTGWPTTALRLQPDGAVAFGARNTERLRPFHSLDVRAQRTFTLEHGELDLFAEVINVLNRENECCVTFTAERSAAGPTVLTRSVDHWLGVTPSVGILWRYRAPTGD